MMHNAKVSLLLVAVVACGCVHADVETTTKCSLSFYRYLFNLPGEQIRPNVPEGTYLFGKRVGPPTEDAQASNPRPSVVKPDTEKAPSYEAPQYLPPALPSTTYLPPPPVTTTTTTTTPRPSTSAPLYIPPAPEASNTIAVISPPKPACADPKHDHSEQPLPSINVPKYTPYVPPKQPIVVAIAPPKYVAPKFVAAPPLPAIVIPKYTPYVPPPQPEATYNVPEYVVPQFNEIVPSFRYPVPTPPPAKHCDKYTPAPAPITTTTTTTTTTTPAPEFLETRYNDVVVPVGSLQDLDAKPDCGHEHHRPEPVPSASAGYSYDKPSPSFAYPQVTGYTYPKPSPSFEYPASGFSGQATSLFESQSSKSSAGATEDGDLVILKV